MSRWLDLVRQKSSAEPRVPIVPIVPKGRSSEAFGTIGTNGTAPEIEVLERQAIAEVEGGVPPLYSAGFARLQLTPPPGLSIPRWLQAVDDAGWFLDAFGQQALSMGWRSDDLFRSDGLMLALQGEGIIQLTSTTAVHSDGRTFQRRR